MIKFEEKEWCFYLRTFKRDNGGHDVTYGTSAIIITQIYHFSLTCSKISAKRIAIRHMEKKTTSNEDNINRIVRFKSEIAIKLCV